MCSVVLVCFGVVDELDHFLEQTAEDEDVETVVGCEEEAVE